MWDLAILDVGLPDIDGRLLFVSRPSFRDVVALRLSTGKLVWRTQVEGNRSDHMAISPDGTRLAVSASTARKVHILDTKTGRIAAWSEEQFVGRFGVGMGQSGSHMPWKQFQKMPEEDVRAIYRYLRSLDPVQNATGPIVQRRQDT
jgi:hypothetical protein